MAPLGGRVIPRRLLWIDSLGGLAVGAAVLALHAWLAGLYGLPSRLVFALGCANLVYGTYSLTLAPRRTRPRAAILVLIGANAFWAIACVALAFRFFDSATAFGVAALTAEAVYVGGLAALEWRWREALIAGDAGA